MLPSDIQRSNARPLRFRGCRCVVMIAFKQFRWSRTVPTGLDIFVQSMVATAPFVVHIFKQQPRTSLKQITRLVHCPHPLFGIYFISWFCTSRCRYWVKWDEDFGAPCSCYDLVLHGVLRRSSGVKMRPKVTSCMSYCGIAGTRQTNSFNLFSEKMRSNPEKTY